VGTQAMAERTSGSGGEANVEFLRGPGVGSKDSFSYTQFT
jgi:hypothetical protein